MVKRNTEQNPSQVADKIFGKEDILSIPTPEPILLHIDSLGADVYVRKMTGTDLEDYEVLMFEVVEGEDGQITIEKKRDSVRTKWLVICLCDAKGNRLFESSDYISLNMKPAKVLEEMYDKSQEANDIAPQEESKKRKKS